MVSSVFWTEDLYLEKELRSNAFCDLRIFVKLKVVHK